MLVFCNGMPRSGSTWSFNVCRLLLERLRPAESLCARYHENIAEVVDPLLGSYDHLVLKCHALDDRGRELCRSGNALTVYTHRDPSDAICSIMEMFRHSFEDSLDAIRRSLDLREFHARSRNAHILAYEAIRNTPREATASVADFLKLHASPDILDGIVQDTSFEAVKSIADQVSLDQGAIATPRSMYDPKTHIHRNHIRDGGVGYGRVRLSAQQLRRVEEVLAPYMAYAQSPLT